MKTEEEIKAFIESIKTAEKSVSESNMVAMTERQKEQVTGLTALSGY